MSKRKRGDDEDPGWDVDGDQYAARMAARDVREAHEPREGSSRVEAETLGYLQEVSAHHATLQDAEERQLLVANVLEEISGKEVRIATDAVASRLLEQLLVGAPAAQLMQLLAVFTDAESLYKVAGSAFGSFVVQNILESLHGQADSLSQEEADELETLLDQLLEAMKDSLQEYIQDKHATHVPRRLLCVMAGRDVLPPNRTQPGKAAKHKHGQRPAVGTLAEKLAGSQAEAGQELPPARFPRPLSKVARLMLRPEVSGQALEALARNPYSGPFLQGLLRAVQGDTALLRQLLPRAMGADAPSGGGAPQPGQALAALKEGHMGKLLRDVSCSRLLEVAVAVAPPDMAEEFYARFLKGRLLSLASHHCANFVVQSTLAAAHSKEQVKALFTELEPVLGELLKRNRSGVVAALVAACGRVNVCQREVCAALARALAALPQWQGDTGKDRLARALLTLDTAAVLEGNQHSQQQQQQDHSGYDEQWGNGAAMARLSTPGSALLIQLLHYPKNCCAEFAESLASLSASDAARVARDPGGSRACEALLASAVAQATKLRLLSVLAGHWSTVALTAPGSFFVEKAYALGDLEHKEAVTSELVAASKALERTHWGPQLLRRVGAEAYERSPDEWRRRAQSAAVTMRQFADVFGGEAGPKGGESKSKKRKQQKLEKRQQQQQTQQEEQEEQEEAGEPAETEEGKKQQRHERQQQQGNGQDQTQTARKNRKRKQQRDEQDNVEEARTKKANMKAADAAPSSAPQPPKHLSAEAQAAALGGSGADAALAVLGFANPLAPVAAAAAGASKKQRDAKAGKKAKEPKGASQLLQQIAAQPGTGAEDNGASTIGTELKQKQKNRKPL